MKHTIGNPFISLSLTIGTIFLFSCSGPDSPEKEQPLTKEDLPEHIQQLDNLTVYDANNPAQDTVELVRETVFENNNEVFFDGYTGEVLVDDNNRVYIVASIPGTVGVYVFDPDGSFVTKFLREGRGPGEFESIGSLIINNRKLYVFGPRLQKIGIFSLDDYSLIDDYKIERSVLKDDSSSVYRATELIRVYDNGSMLTRFTNVNRSDPNNKRNILYYKLSPKAVVQPGVILEQLDTHLYKPDTRRNSDGYIRLARSMPFTPSPFLAAHGNYIYTAHSSRFLVKGYDENGAYQRAFYYPYKKSALSTSDLDLYDSQMQLINENSNQVPDTWPALHTMEMDDEGRFWLLTINDSDSTYQGWVLNEKGALLAKFVLPGERNKRNAGIPPLFKIKNGYLYTREQDIRQGIDRIVKSKINFKSRDFQEDLN